MLSATYFKASVLQLCNQTSAASHLIDAADIRTPNQIGGGGSTPVCGWGALLHREGGLNFNRLVAGLL
uniref:Peptidase S1 domain-containing protein n=1 Tax=Panagrellus redivivus TaxID=6233 RepID=A0A7E4W8C7_PANRE